MAIDPDKIRERHLRAAEGYLMLEMPDQALRDLNRIRDLGKDAFRAHLLRGEVQLLKHEHGPALDEFRKAHLEKPTDLMALMKMAWCFKRVEQIPQAIDAMKLAYQFHPDKAVVLYNLSCYCALAGEKDNALSWLGRALRMDRTFLKNIADESDFDSLRNDSDFLYLLELTSNQKS